MRYAEGENGRIKFNDFFPREIFELQRYEFFGNNAKVILFFFICYRIYGILQTESIKILQYNKFDIFPKLPEKFTK